MTVERLISTAIGTYRVEATDVGVVALDGVVSMSAPGATNGTGDDDVAPARGPGDRHLDRLAEQFRAYCAGGLREFDVPVDFDGAGIRDSFALEVYREICSIPYGETATYGQISVDAGRPRNARTVGRLCSRAPVSLLIPVHRVVRADGGMGSCPEYRLRLLAHERRNSRSATPIPIPHGPVTVASRS